MRCLFIATDWGRNANLPQEQQHGGVSYYRLLQPKRVLETMGYEIDYMGQSFNDLVKDDWANKTKEVVKDYDVVVCKHLDNFGGSQALINATYETKTPLIFDIDDNVLALESTHPKYGDGYHPFGKKREVVAVNLSLADHIVVSTQPLKDYFDKFFKDVFKIKKDITVIPNTVNPKDWKKIDKNNDKIVIGYHGSITHDEDLKMFIPAFIELTHKYGSKIELVLLGNITNKWAEWFMKYYSNYGQYLRIEGGTPSWYGFPERLAEMNFDIGIAPLVDTEFNRGKSHIKWMEYSLLETPCVASRVYPYFSKINGVETIRDGHTGFLAGNKQEWVDKLSKLIDDEVLRKKIGKNAYNHVTTKWITENFMDKWDNVLKNVASGK